jgi:hypothetical protein
VSKHIRWHAALLCIVPADLGINNCWQVLYLLSRRSTRSSPLIIFLLLLHLLHRMPLINLLHNLLCPPDRIADRADCCRNPRAALVLRQLSCGENASGDQQHALAAFVHESRVSSFALYSPLKSWHYGLHQQQCTNWAVPAPTRKEYIIATQAVMRYSTASPRFNVAVESIRA